jgi:hypothetical protein
VAVTVVVGVLVTVSVAVGKVGVSVMVVVNRLLDERPIGKDAVGDGVLLGFDNVSDIICWGEGPAAAGRLVLTKREPKTNRLINRMR